MMILRVRNSALRSTIPLPAVAYAEADASSEADA